jgi:hypothetical protein
MIEEAMVTTRALGERCAVPNGLVPGIAGSLRDVPTDKRQTEVEVANHQLNVVMDRLKVTLTCLEDRLEPALIPTPEELELEKLPCGYGSLLAQSIYYRSVGLHEVEQRLQRLLNNLAF